MASENSETRPIDTNAKLELTLFLGVPLRSELSTRAADVLKQLVAYCEFLGTQSDRFEILVVPYGPRGAAFYPKFLQLEHFVRRHPQRIRILPSPQPARRADALKKAVAEARGEHLIFSDPEQPCALDFLQKALALSRSGYDCVRANRRLSQTRFRTPVRLLPFIYRRHKMSVIFNRIVRKVFALKTSDVQSTNYILRREFAQIAFANSRLSSMAFEIELALQSKKYGRSEIDLPCHILLAEEKNSRRVLAESLEMAKNLGQLFFRSQNY